MKYADSLSMSTDDKVDELHHVLFIVSCLYIARH
jgi:hypothetical protein